MSGGSMDYLYSRVEDAARTLCSSPLAYRRALGSRLLKVATALHNIEWVDSGDYGEGDDKKAIQVVLSSTAVLEELISNAEKLLGELPTELDRVKKEMK